MTWSYYLLVSLHLLAALFWLGGMFFLGIVGAPVLRTVTPAAVRQRIFHELGTRFRSAGWVAIGVLLSTGALLLHVRGLLQRDVLGDAAFWGTAFGHALGVKLAAVAVIVAGSAVHDFGLGPAAGRVPADSPEAQRLRRGAALLGRFNAMVALVLVLAAVRLARG